MWGRKSADIADLKRKNRVQAAEIADLKDELRATRYAARTATRLYAEDSRGQRLARALRACAGYRAELGRQARVTKRLSDNLLDSVGHNAGYLIPAARAALGLDKETAE
nr:hypothetical protein OG409_07810 [Streptomyces sp. NBC_00974]